MTEAAVSLFLRQNTRRGTRSDLPLRELVPTMRFDSSVVRSMQNRFGTSGLVTGDILLLSCRKSPRYLREACSALGSGLI